MPEPLTQKEVLRKLARGEQFGGVKIGDVDFREYTFKVKINFSGAIFTGTANFARAEFLNGVTFYTAKFTGGEVNFTAAKFHGKEKISFRRSHFSGDGRVNFYQAQFHCEEITDFFMARFTGKGGVIFDRAQFFEGASFLRVIFSGKEGMSFSNSTFSGPGKISFEKTTFEEGQTSMFERVKIDSHGYIEFVDVSTLGNVLFLYSDLEKIGFKNVRFRQTQNQFFNREYLADEERSKIIHKKYREVEYNRDYYSQVSILYRKLRENFEGQLDFHRAGDFHYGELEMRRKAKMLEWKERPISKFLPSLRYFNLTQLYKIVSGYGEKWQQSLASFLAVWLVFTCLNLFWVEPKVADQQQIVQLTQWYQDPIHAFQGSALFSFKVLTLQRWERDFQLKGIPYFPKFFVAVQHLIGPTIIALMLLAIRRQFRR